MIQVQIQPRGDLSTQLHALQNEVKRLQPSRSSGTLLRRGTSGVVRTAIPGRSVSRLSTGAAFY
jgi:hypothetical protein